MTHFATTLLAAIESTKVSMREVGRITGIDISILSPLASGRLAPSRKNLQALCTKLNPQHFPHFATEFGYELLFAYLRDCAEKGGLDVSSLSIGVSSDSDWWAKLPQTLRETLKAIGEGVKADDQFAALIRDLQPIVLRLLGMLKDARDLEKIRKGTVYPFPDDHSAKVNEHSPVEISAAKQDHRRGAQRVRQSSKA